MWTESGQKLGQISTKSGKGKKPSGPISATPQSPSCILYIEIVQLNLESDAQDPLSLWGLIFTILIMVVYIVHIDLAALSLSH